MKAKRHSIPVLPWLSKCIRSFAPLYAVGFIAILSSSSRSQIDVTIRIAGGANPSATISGRFLVPRPSGRNLSLLNDYAGITNLGRRISDLRVIDKTGREISIKMFAPGEYVAESDIDGWSYKIDLKPPSARPRTAHVSWVADETGILMLADILPVTGGANSNALIRLDVPTGWRVTSSSWREEWNSRVIGVNDVGKAVLLVGKDWRRGFYGTDALIETFLWGQWESNDDEVEEQVQEVFGGYGKVFGALPFGFGGGQLALIRVPDPAPPNEWEADVRGNTITIVSSATIFRSQSAQRLHEQLRHEMFHLWLPNGVNLTGNYDWFYEGSALYQSLKLGVAVNRIQFDDMLDTLGRAYDVDRQLNGKLSLIDASKNRWSGDNNTRIYARGMLVAFLCDLALLNSSKGKRSTDGIVREVYSKYRQPFQPRDGTSAVLEILKSNAELIPIVDQYISGTKALDWSAYLRLAGIEAASVDGATRLAVSQKPTGQQKKLLDKLGYNNWRKLSQGSK